MWLGYAGKVFAVYPKFRLAGRPRFVWTSYPEVLKFYNKVFENDKISSNKNIMQRNVVFVALG